MEKSPLRMTVQTVRRAVEKRAKERRAPQRPEDVISEFTNDYQEIYGEDLLSICLYGSGVRGNYIPGRSDLNFLIVLTEEGIKGLHRAFKAVAKWHRRRVTTPLCMTPAYITTSLDTFPLELLNIKQDYRVVWGKDLLAKVKIRQRQLRLQLEREAKGKLLQLREAYLASKGRKRDLVAVASQSLTTFLSIFEGILYLLDKEIPHQRGAIIQLIAAETGLAAEPFERLLELKEGKAKLSGKKLKALMESYIEEVRRLAFWVDEM